MPINQSELNLSVQETSRTTVEYIPVSGNFENDSIMGRPGSPDVGKLMRSAIVTGRVSSPLQNATKVAYFVVLFCTFLY